MKFKTLLATILVLLPVPCTDAQESKTSHYIRGTKRKKSKSSLSTNMSKQNKISRKAKEGRKSKESTKCKVSESSSDDTTCSPLSSFPHLGRDNAERLLLREGVIDAIPKSRCNNGGKNVILVIGDGMGWEMIRAGAIARLVLNELQAMGIDTKTGASDEAAAAAARQAFQGRTLNDYYTEGKGSGLSFQDELEGYAIMTSSSVFIGEANPGNKEAPYQSLLQGKISQHDKGMAPLLLNECGNPIDFSPLDYKKGGNMVLWDDKKGGMYPWDKCYYTEGQNECDPTFIMQHAPDSAACAGSIATGNKAASNMLSLNIYEEEVSTLVEDAMYCGKAGGVVSSVFMLDATPAGFIAHANNRHDVNQLQRSFLKANPTLASGICFNNGKHPDPKTIQSMKDGALSSQWTFFYQQDGINAENFYGPVANLDPDNGDHLIVCLGGEYSSTGSKLENLPLRGVDSTYAKRWCSRGNVVKDPPNTGIPIGVEAKSGICPDYSPDDLSQIPHISKSVEAALNFLGKADRGFFLMYEQGDIDWSAHGNRMDDLLGAMLDIDDSVKTILDWIRANGGWEKNALYVTADHDHYLTLEPNFPQVLANLLINGESHNITPENNTSIDPWVLAIQAGRHQDDSKSQVEHIRDFTTWTDKDVQNVGHFWGPRGGGGNAWGQHTSRPLPLAYMGDDGCIEQFVGKGYQVVGRQVEGSNGKIDHVHLHACMLRSLLGL